MLFYNVGLVYFNSFKLFVLSQAFIQNFAVMLIVFTGFYLLIKFKESLQ